MKAPSIGYDLVSISFVIVATLALAFAAFWFVPAGGPPPAPALFPPTYDTHARWIILDSQIQSLIDLDKASAQRNLSGREPLADTLRQHPDCPATPPTQAPAAPESYDPRLWNRDPRVQI